MRPSPQLAIQNYLHSITGLVGEARPQEAQPRRQPELILKRDSARPGRPLGGALLRRTLPVLLVGFFAVAARTAPLTLDDAIREALQKNPRVRVSAFSRGISRANVLQQLGHFDPALTFRRSYSQNDEPVAESPLVTQFGKTDNYGLSLDGIMPWGLTYSLGGTATNSRGPLFGTLADNYATFGGVTVTQPLLRGFGFGANLAGLRVAKADRGISDWSHKQTLIDTVTNVVFAYSNVLLARDNLRIATFSRDLAAQLLDENEKRNRVGALSDADVTQARARVANREESILLAARALHDAENQLRALLGETNFATNGVPLDLAPLPPVAPITISPADDLKQAFNVRPDYQAARLGLVKNRAGDSLAQNQLLPRVDFVGSYGYNGLDRSFATARQEVRDEDHRAYSAGLVVSVPLTFAEGRGRARAARLTVRQTEADLARLEQDIAIAVAAAAGQIETTRERVAATRTAFELAKQALDAEQKRFRAGTSRTLDVLQLQEQLAAVESSQVRALADERRAIANYERELGSTLERRQIAWK